MRKRAQKAAIVLGVAIVVWWLLPEIALLLGAGLVLGLVALKVLLIAFVIFALWLVSTLFWDLSKSLYRRFVSPYLRARRIERIRNYRSWQEAASRNNSEHH